MAAAVMLGRKRKSGAVDSPVDMSGLCTPPLCTPPWQGDLADFNFISARKRLLRRNSSVSIASSMSSITNGSSPDDAGKDVSWTEEELTAVQNAYSRMCETAARLDTPFVGPPPSQLTHQVARTLCRQHAWRHTIKATRAKILESAKDSMQWQMEVDDTPVQGDVEATPRRSKRLARRISSEILPHHRDRLTLARLSHKLQRRDSNDSDVFSRTVLENHHTEPDVITDPAKAYPSPAATPSRSGRLKRATSMAIGEAAVKPQLGRTMSDSHAAASSAPDVALYGEVHTPLTSPIVHLATPFQGYGPTPRRFPLLRSMSTLSIHSPGGGLIAATSPRSASPSSYLSSSAASSSTRASTHGEAVESFLHPQYGVLSFTSYEGCHLPRNTQSSPVRACGAATGACGATRWPGIRGDAYV